MEPDPTFKAFNPYEKVQVYHRHLPHWQQSGATYFVTFRVADSIPKSILLQWAEERELWLKAHGINDSLTDEERTKCYRLIPEIQRRNFERDEARKLHIELDKCHGCCCLKLADNAQILRRAILHFHGERCWIGDFIIMPNHVHLLIQPFDVHPLERWLQSIKSFAVRRFTGKEQLKNSRVFQQESYDRIVRHREELERFRKYIAENGAKAKLGPADYIYHRCDWL